MNREETIQKLREVIAAQTVCYPTISQAEVIFQTVFEKAQAPTGDERGVSAQDVPEATHVSSTNFRRPTQTEPTDAQVNAAAKVFWDRMTRETPIDAMRAALKAAFTAGQEEPK